MTRPRPYPVWLKPVVFAAGLVTPAWIAYGYFTGRLGANPIAEALNQLGLASLVSLLVALAASPLHKLSAWGRAFYAAYRGTPRRPGWAWPLALRRMLGLFAFFYVTLHLAVYVAADQGFAWDEIFKDITKRKFITVGFAAFVMLAPLAATSFDRMVKRLGFRWWKRLHRLVYPAAVAAIVHFVWREKVPGFEQYAYAAALAVLLALRALPKPTRGPGAPV